MSQTNDTVIEDKIMVSILKEQGYSWGKDTSSYYNPQALYDALARYSPDKAVDVDMTTPEWKRAFAATYKVFAKPKYLNQLIPLYQPEQVYKALKVEKSSGLPAMTSKEDDFWYAYNRAEQVLLGTKAPSPCIALKRSQLGGKVRLVWGYPLEMTIIESRFARPLIATFLERTTTMAFGLSKFVLGGRVAKIDDSYGQTYGLDFSKFDSTVPANLIHAAFDILKTWFDGNDLDALGWDVIEDYFIHTPIVMMNGKCYFGKRHGVPSGSYFTQLIDSIVNTMLQFWLANLEHYSLSWEGFMVLGDDVIISIPREVSLHKLAKHAESIGMIIHPEKSVKRAHFLGATWIKGLPYRCTEEILKKMAYPENYRMYPAKEYLSRFWLAQQLMMQYAASYANVFPMLEKAYGTGNCGMVDESPHFILQAHGVQEWYREIVSGANQWIIEEPTPRRLLSARLMA